MSKRLVITAILTLIMLPLGAYAEDQPLAPTDSQAAPTDSSAPSDAKPSPTPNPSAGLGPSSNPGSTGGSNADAASLQPANGSTLQLITGAASGNQNASANALQSPATSDQVLRVLDGETDGPAHQTDSNSPSFWGWLGFTALFGILAALSAAAFRYKPRR